MRARLDLKCPAVNGFLVRVEEHGLEGRALEDEQRAFVEWHRQQSCCRKRTDVNKRKKERAHEFARCLAELMKAAHVSAGMLADRALLSHASVSNMLSGRLMPCRDTAERLERVLGELAPQAAEQARGALVHAMGQLPSAVERLLVSRPDLLEPLVVLANEQAR